MSVNDPCQRKITQQLFSGTLTKCESRCRNIYCKSDNKTIVVSEYFKSEYCKEEYCKSDLKFNSKTFV